jgi:hypothetical protein
MMIPTLEGKTVVASISGGKDSAAMSLHLRERGIEHRRVFMDTGWEAGETYDYLRGELTRVPCTDCVGPAADCEYCNGSGTVTVGTYVPKAIDEVVAWSNTAHGGRQADMFAAGVGDEGCMRWGLCDHGNGDAP